MNQKEKIKKYRENIQVEASEEKIQETIFKSKNALFYGRARTNAFLS